MCSVFYVSVNSKGAHPAPSNRQRLRHLNFRKLHNQITPCQGTEKLSNSNSPEHSSYVRLYTIVNTFLCNVFYSLLVGDCFLSLLFWLGEQLSSGIDAPILDSMIRIQAFCFVKIKECIFITYYVMYITLHPNFPFKTKIF